MSDATPPAVLRLLVVDDHEVVRQGLVALTEQLHQNNLVEVSLELPERLDEPPAHVRAELLQIAREALSNVARHAGATQATVRLAADDTDLQLEIRDNGRGFDPGTTPREGHFGLANMQARAAALGGGLVVESAAGGGTHIIVRIPVGGYEEARTVDG